ncbi:N-acetyllactosaminide beta-1,6-N-acetylglucosaminyl-transferase-like isoform X1 [Haliotis cracherodii]|uniref:N-acetyllactosaminide beta-1,6-N-acetylglucosaminyl-transferase-like isoform X1 n=2 Tax=Haliotis cracherodii TaxID=6455 RepID=UPI0039E9FDF1
MTLTSQGCRTLNMRWRQATRHPGWVTVMWWRGSRTLMMVLLLAVVCYTSIRLVSVTMELENVRRGHKVTLVDNSRPVGFVPVPHNSTNSTGYKYTFKYSSFPQYKDFPIDCRRMFEGDMVACEKAGEIRKNVAYKLPSDHDVYKEAIFCESFIARHGYGSSPVSEEEKAFPIAYSILLYKDVAQVNLLLKAIYRSHNVYCLHVDGKSDQSVHLAAKAVSDCLKNVFIVSKTESVVYAGFTRLQADINCMADLTASPVDWKYFINLPSQQYPLKTNAEIVKILKIYNGSNDIEGITGARMLSERFVYKHVYIKKTNSKILIKRTEEKNPPAPHNITTVKGSAYGVFSRAFVDFILNDIRARDLLQWSKGVLSPDEYYWATLHHSAILNPPGGYTGKPDDKDWLATYASWAPEHCAGRRLRGVCVFTEGDLSFLATKRALFANKFLLPGSSVALMCLEQWIHNKSLSDLPFDSYYYQQLPFVKH